MAIGDYVGQRIRLRAQVAKVGHRSGRWSAERNLILRAVFHAETGELLGRDRAVVCPKPERRSNLTNGSSVEFEAKISRPRDEDYFAIVDASGFEVL